MSDVSKDHRITAKTAVNGQVRNCSLKDDNRTQHRNVLEVGDREKLFKPDRSMMRKTWKTMMHTGSTSFSQMRGDNNNNNNNSAVFCTYAYTL